MARVRTLACATCGGPLDIEAGRATVECTYCGRTLLVERDQTRTQAVTSTTVADTLLRGYDGRFVGRGQRFGVAAMRQRDPLSPERCLWPIDATASSAFGSGWTPDVVTGPPRVYPRLGDIQGAWAPRARTSHTEWLEARFRRDAPPALAIRVFETNVPGSTFAVTVSDDGGDDELVYQAAPTPGLPEAQVLEISLAPPRRVRAVRAYVVNDRSWTEIDTICLVSAEPLPHGLRTVAAPPAPTPSRAGGLAAGLGLVVAITAGVVFLAAGGQRNATPSAMPAPALVVPGTTIAPWPVDPGTLRTSGIVWAREGLAASSEYQAARWNRHAAAGPPDVFPAFGDREQAWATADEDAGHEWLVVGFGEGVDASAVVIVETFNPGALVRIDDLSDPSAPAVLFEGTTPRDSASRVLRLALPEPRRVRRLRLVLDTARVPGWNEIDAVGLVPVGR